MSDSSTTMTSSREEVKHTNDKLLHNKKLTSYLSEIILNIIETNQDDDYEYEMIMDCVFNSINTFSSTINELLDIYVDLCEINETSLIIAHILLDRFIKKSKIKLNIFNIHK